MKRVCGGEDEQRMVRPHSYSFSAIWCRFIERFSPLKCIFMHFSCFNFNLLRQRSSFAMRMLLLLRRNALTFFSRMCVDVLCFGLVWCYAPFRCEILTWIFFYGFTANLNFSSLFYCWINNFELSEWLLWCAIWFKLCQMNESYVCSAWACVRHKNVSEFTCRAEEVISNGN